MKITIYTILALIAFAGNSVLCRLALGNEAVDAPSFTTIRLISGALVLFVLLGLSKRLSKRVATRQHAKANASKGSWLAALMLFIYAAGFSYAYLTLDTGVGALILFASVQITMILTGVVAGKTLHNIEWLGVFISIAGFAYLMLPGASMPSTVGFVLMSCAGVAWGFYSLMGRGSADPLADTTYNFVRTLPLVAVLALISFKDVQVSYHGFWLAVLSGAVTSGAGYTIWYMALRGLTSVQAAVVQLFVPVLASLGGVVFASELLTARLVIASLLILGGILLVIFAKQYHKPVTE